ncbi:MAG: 50S ribosomal protein L32e [Methanocella sp. PtaU1.Bin125]|nr:MAG: 50S ribosomal protein L32e [Methanocella sp. PtaU1.Bin125]
MAEEKKKSTKKTTGKKAADVKSVSEKKPKATTKKSAKAAKTEATEVTEVAQAPETTGVKAEAGEAKKVKGVRKESAKAETPTAKPRPLPRPVEESTLDLDPETRRLLEARKTNKASLPHFHRVDSHKKACLDPSWRRAKGHHSQKRRQRKPKGANVKIGYGSPAAVAGFHPSGYQEVLVYRPEDVAGITKTQAIRVGGTVGRRKQLEIEKIAKEQHIKVLNPLNTFEGAQ